ncbi:oxygen-independent coproporphyrinogen-3 oxidase [Belliella buryatensis]|uniref:Heme chaperone HemW n=2 Tax=Belliella buryatensis TaxID=1500549 RepID=A0A239BNH5_9BACT|nr:oxygen-independent coproporphyrinogen-3 oxidase [Belliella buryatensis]
MIQMINRELLLRKDYLPEKDTIKSIYFGGGTPSLLSQSQLDSVLNTIHKNFTLDIEELTIETNPDDLSQEKLKSLKHLGFDRLSIGIQSFQEDILKFYNRAHKASESLQAISLAKDAGFSMLSIDLIYGFPSPDHKKWEKDLEIAINQDPGHISSYCLTVEPKTALGNWVAKGKFRPATEDFAAEQFEILQAAMQSAGYVQYEISNFGKEGHFAIHNTNYWRGIPYLGVGPSAHSFDGKERGANISNNNKYIESLNAYKPPFEIDYLSHEDLVNEYILTSLRTIWGTDLHYLLQTYHVDLFLVKSSMIQKLIQEKLLEVNNTSLILTAKGKLLADSIASALFI